MTVSLVTGCSTGIGAAIALRLAREGHTVHASVRTEASGAPLLAAASDLDLSLVLMDVDDGDSVAAGIESVIGQSGRVDVLVNNAGISWWPRRDRGDAHRGVRVAVEHEPPRRCALHPGRVAGHARAG